MKQLTPTETQGLFQLVERHAIKYYDVQIEIVDHYASAIEKIWETEPHLSFLEAQKRVYQEFWDFKNLETEKRKALEKGYEKQLLEELKTWLQVPKLILSLLFGYAIFQITKEVDLGIYYLMNFIFYISLFSFFYRSYRSTILESKFKNKFLQLDTAGGATGIGTTFGILSIQWADSLWTFNMGVFLAIFIPVWVMTMIFGYFRLNQIIKKIHLNFKPI